MEERPQQDESEEGEGEEEEETLAQCVRLAAWKGDFARENTLIRAEISKAEEMTAALRQQAAMHKVNGDEEEDGEGEDGVEEVPAATN